MRGRGGGPPAEERTAGGLDGPERDSGEPPSSRTARKAANSPARAERGPQTRARAGRASGGHPAPAPRTHLQCQLRGRPASARPPVARSELNGRRPASAPSPAAGRGKGPSPRPGAETAPEPPPTVAAGPGAPCPLRAAPRCSPSVASLETRFFRLFPGELVPRHFTRWDTCT